MKGYFNLFSIEYTLFGIAKRLSFLFSKAKKVTFYIFQLYDSFPILCHVKNVVDQTEKKEGEQITQATLAFGAFEKSIFRDLLLIF